jgi:hypothetical protein
VTTTVDALLPLSLLEAVRDVDTPGDLDQEFVDELRNKRLGLSDTVYLQIKRYSDAVRKGQRTGQDESNGLATLIGRRPDAEAVFRAAGQFLARQAYKTINPLTRRMLRLLPSFLARPIALRRSRSIASRYLNGKVCSYYEAVLRELLKLLIGSVGSVDHVRCAGRGEGTCEWRADWKTFDATA